jgi:hypothetical protein
MARDRDQLDQDRADLLAALTEAGEPLWTSTIIDRTRTYDVQHGSAEWRQVVADLRALERAGRVVCLQRSAYTKAGVYVLAGSREADEHEDLAELRRMLSEDWEPTS